jgi:hypothetical protein
MAISQSDIEAWFDLEEGTGDPDDSTSSLTATNSAGVEWSTTVPSSSAFTRSLRLTSDDVTVGATTDLLLSSGFVSVWMRLDDVSNGNQVIASKAGTTTATKNWYFYVVSAGTVYAALLNTSGSEIALVESSALSDATWYHVVFTWGGGTTRLFVDGSSADSNTYTNHNYTGEVATYIGRRGSTYLAAGNIAQIIFGNKLLDLTEAQSLYNSAAGVTYDDFFGPTTYSSTINSGAFILKSHTKTINKNANILSASLQSLSGNSVIFYGLSKVTLVSPSNTGGSVSPVVFVWEVPTDSVGRNVHTRIEIDTVDTFDSENLIVKKSYIDSGFEYYTDSWVEYPGAGVESTYYNNQARLSVSLSESTWYWRVRGEVTNV